MIIDALVVFLGGGQMRPKDVYNNHTHNILYINIYEQQPNNSVF